MRAALLAAVREPFVVEDIDYLDPAPGRVLIRTGASPFCSTDCVNWRGELCKIPPTILGHASMGEVVEVGAGVDHIKVGHRVDRAGHLGVRRVLLLLDRPPRSVLGDVRPRRDLAARRQPPRPASRSARPATSAATPRSMNVTANQVFPVRDRPARRVAEPARLRHHDRRSAPCFNVARVQAGSSVAIFGLGHLGQWMVQAAKARECPRGSSRSTRSPSVASSPAGSAPPTLVDPEADDPVEQVKALTEGRGADYTLEAATLASA